MKKSKDRLSEVINFRLTPYEKQKLEFLAKTEDKTTSEWIRAQIQAIPIKIGKNVMQKNDKK